ncbi:GH3 auxin-responsive promoter-domain-containing protein [Pisolithus orientalis]|uniref:GH3 auxin-responsive promoter-domain-containing protein n=1 Tax=Pisolithus orientalis TaxID=936130 RepID=UPI002225663E|nr:GH3 auxin-responsive promoter-domain-containing protein [Pisolithus orientalis]KAI5995277.1 GH3 auxin-responsive promoter-domain-containing protein [Pisolithus orientalis]
MSPSQVPRPVHVLSPDLVSVLKNRVEATMLAIIKKNRHTRCFSESPAFAAFHSAIRNFGREDNDGISDDILLDTFRTTISLTTYDSYELFVAKFLSETCQEDDVRDMFSPGLPYHIAVTSSTSSPKPKFFCQYLHEGSMRYGGVKIQNRNGDLIRTIPVAMGSFETVRLRNGLKVENDHLNIILAAGEWVTSPVAVGFIREYRTFLLMHTLFALAHSKVETIFIVFTTSAVDMIRYMEEEWESLVASIETVGKPTDQPGWLLKIWPMLKSVISIGSGVFSVAVPKLRFHLGSDVQLRSLGFHSSKTHVATVYDPSDLNLFKATSQDIIEYFDVTKEENASSIVPPWLVEIGKHYEVVCTTHDGLWRYRLGDIVEIAGFDPTDGSPIICVTLNDEGKYAHNFAAFLD